MSSLIASVIRAEGLASAWRRSTERMGEALTLRLKLLRGVASARVQVPVLNVCGMPVVERLGGVPIQLRARLAQESAWREWALFHPGVLEGHGGAVRVRSLDEAIARSGARLIHVEGCFGLDLPSLLRLPDHLKLVLSLHDLDLLKEDLSLRAALLASANRVVYASDFLQSAYGVPGLVIEPASPAKRFPAAQSHAQRIAWVGSLKQHKGAELLPYMIACTPAAQWEIFGGGDPPLLRPLRGLPNVRLHGYYRSGELPRLLVQRRIGLALLPSVMPEGFGLTLSECWLAGVPALVFAHGAQAQRIAQLGGGWCVPLDQGAAGLAQHIQQWLAGELHTRIDAKIPTPLAAAQAHQVLYADLLD